MSDDLVKVDNRKDVEILGFDTEARIEVDYGDGNEYDIPACKGRFAVHLWSNGALMEGIFYDEPREDADFSDRIHLIVTPEGRPSSGFIMNITDATAMIAILSKGIGRCIGAGIPVGPEEVETK